MTSCQCLYLTRMRKRASPTRGVTQLKHTSPEMNAHYAANSKDKKRLLAIYIVVMVAVLNTVVVFE
jgi:hypothetical protein